MSFINTFVLKLWKWYKGHEGVTDAHHTKYTDVEAVTAVNTDDKYLKKDGTEILTADWDIGDGRKIKTDDIRARDAAGLKLYDDGGNGILVEDGGLINLNSPSGNSFEIYSNTVLRSKMTWSGQQTWYLNKGTAECGRIAYSTPGGFPGILFLNTFGEGRSQIRQTRWNGGLGFAASTGSASPPDQVCITTIGRVGIGTAAPSTLFDINSDKMRVRTAKTPATAGAAGNQGDICWDANYVYVCTATNTWKRSGIASW